MPGGDDAVAAQASSLRRGQFTYLPVVPHRLEFALEVRRALLAERPEVIAVELPQTLEPVFREAIERLPEMSVVMELGSGEDNDGSYMVIEPADPFIEAVRTSVELGAELLFIEPDTLGRPHPYDLYPDTYALSAISTADYVNTYRLNPQTRTEEFDEHAAGMAWRLQGADPERKTAVVVSLNQVDALLDAMETPQEQPAFRRRGTIELINPHPESLSEITLEPPFYSERYEDARRAEPLPEFIDRRKLQYALLKEAGVAYEAQTGDKLALWQQRMMARYTRNLALLDHQMTAGLFDIVLAARSIVDDNYGWEVWQTANSYRWQLDHSPHETLRLRGEDVFNETRRMRLRPRRPRPKQMLRPRSLKPRRKEAKPGEWTDQLKGDAICSYPPEDLVIEDYGRFLRQKARSVLTTERARVEPFSTSVLDGVDLRETVRRWHEKKMYVRREERMAGDVGAVVVIFDEDRDNRYSYLTTWLGEHQNESDMAFYSTPPFEHVIGPGIGRAEYGGFLMTLPSRRMYDVWADPDYDFAATKSERLLMAALDYSVERHVVYVSARPPRSIFRSIAAHVGRSIIYVPIGQLSPARLKKIRVVHILDSYDRRAEAKDYLW